MAEHLIKNLKIVEYLITLELMYKLKHSLKKQVRNTLNMKQLL